MSRKIIFVTSIVACVTWGPLGLAEKAHAAAYSNSKAKDNVSITITHTQVDRHFIQMMEGSKLNGYVPLVHSTQSGVTIAHGFDLGQYSLKEFNNMPID